MNAGPTRKRPPARLVPLGVAAAAALFIAVVVIAVGQSGNDGGPDVEGGAWTTALFDGIPQDGKQLGHPDAGVTMLEFADLQCPFCARYAHDVLPDLMRRYVRPGDVRMEMHVVRFRGPDSDPAARAAAAAARQDKMWQFAEVFYLNQGAENSGYVDDDFIRAVAEAVPGLDADRLMRDMNTAQIKREIDANDYRASTLGVSGTPGFFLSRRGGRLRRHEIRSLELRSFAPALDRLLGAGAER